MKAVQKNLLSIGFSLAMLIFSSRINAQLTSAFVANKTTISCPTETLYFSDSSKGNPTSWMWDFGDNKSSTLTNPLHQYVKSGRYTVTLIVKNTLLQADTSSATIVVLGPTVSYTKIIDTTCSNINVKFSSKATGGNPLVYTWDFGDGKTSTSINSNTTHAYKAAAAYYVNLTVKDTSGCSTKVGETLNFGSVTNMLPTTPATVSANRECDDQYGWTNYYFDSNTPADTKDDILLLSLFKKNNNIGNIGDGTFKVTVGATDKAGSSQGILLTSPVITNPSGYYVMNRYWSVKPTAQPTSSIGVRFYFNNQDLTDINGSFPTHDAEFEQIIFYKTKNGDPNPETGLNGAFDITSIFPGTDASTNQWTYSFMGAGSHAAEFVVADLTGGGSGGITVNSKALPIKLLSFAGKPENTGVLLNWLVSSEINVDRYEVEASVDGKTFNAIGKVQAKGATSAAVEYSFNDAKTSSDTKFYKLVIVDKDGRKTFSQVIKISLNAQPSAVSSYPVPATNSLTITSKNFLNKLCVVEVYNSIGIKVLQSSITSSNNAFQLNTSALPNGRYRAIVSSNNNKLGDVNFIILR